MTLEITEFTDDWYTKKIDNITEIIASKKDADKPAIAVLYAGAFIAQAIDNAFNKPGKGPQPNWLERLATAAENIATAHT